MYNCNTKNSADELSRNISNIISSHITKIQNETAEEIKIYKKFSECLFEMPIFNNLNKIVQSQQSEIRQLHKLYHNLLNRLDGNANISLVINEKNLNHNDYTNDDNSIASNNVVTDDDSNCRFNCESDLHLDEDNNSVQISEGDNDMDTSVVGETGVDSAPLSDYALYKNNLKNNTNETPSENNLDNSTGETVDDDIDGMYADDNSGDEEEDDDDAVSDLSDVHSISLENLTSAPTFPETDGAVHSAAAVQDDHESEVHSAAVHTEEVEEEEEEVEEEVEEEEEEVGEEEEVEEEEEEVEEVEEEEEEEEEEVEEEEVEEEEEEEEVEEEEEEEEEDDDEEELVLEEFDVDGKAYLLDTDTGDIYSLEGDEPIGQYLNKKVKWY